MVLCKLSPPWSRYLEFLDNEGAVSPSLHRLDLSFEGHIPSLILVPYNNVLLWIVTGYGAGDCKSILYSCDRKVISRLYWSPLLGSTGLFQTIHTPYNFSSITITWLDLLSKERSQSKRLKKSIPNIHLHGSFSLISIKSVWCLTWTSLALIGVSFPLLRKLAFRRWLLLSMFRIIRILARLTPENLLGKSLCYCQLFWNWKVMLFTRMSFS